MHRNLIGVYVCYDFAADSMPEQLVADTCRIKYIIQKLILNGIARTKEDNRFLQYTIYVSKEPKTTVLTPERIIYGENDAPTSGLYGYLVCEVQDFGDTLTPR